VLNNIDPKRDVMISDGPYDVLDHASCTVGYGGKIGIDATAKGPAEGYTRGWPEQIRMSADVVDAVTSRWSEYGLDALDGGGGAAPQAAKTSRFARSGRRRT
jgi:4-hydroxy-3-polyprenylbenzoate decarboxylase